MKKLICALVAMLALPSLAAAAQVSADEYRRMYNQYGESNGIYQRKDSNGFELYTEDQRRISIGKTVYEDFTDYGDGDMFCQQTDWTTCSGTAGEVNLLTFESGNKLASFIIVGQTIVGGADMDAGSLDIAGDQTDNDGAEYAWGTYGASGGVYIVGGDDAFYTCASVTIADVSGTDEFHIGWREADDADSATASFNATFDNYHNLVSIGPLAGAITIETIVGDAATTTTDTTDTVADATAVTLCVMIGDAGAVTYTINGGAPTTTAALTWTDSLEVVPFIHFLQDSDLTGEIDVTEWEVGYGTPLTTD